MNAIRMRMVAQALVDGCTDYATQMVEAGITAGDIQSIIGAEIPPEEFLDSVLVKIRRADGVIPASEQHLWNRLIQEARFSSEFLLRHSDRVNWRLANQYQTLSETFMINHQGYINWTIAPIHQDMSESTMRRLASKIDWTSLLAHRDDKVSDELVSEIKHLVDWSSLRYFPINIETRNRFAYELESAPFRPDSYIDAVNKSGTGLFGGV